MNMNNKFSENLKKIRKDNNLSQEQLAEELNVSRQAISKWESAVAYPEMDKIIAIGEKFNINIDDLLHKDIREVKGEEESKNNLIKCVDDFLNFITNTISMFSNMTFRSKLKCLFEQFIIGIILFTIIYIIGICGRDLLSGILGLLPEKIFYLIDSILQIIYVAFGVSVSIMIMLHIFKTRYLNYFENIKLESNKEIANEKEEEKIKVEITDKSSDEIDKENKFLFKRNKKKIIIRDPKHSEYKFITGISKFIVGMIKFFVLCFSLIFFTILIALAFCFIVSFLLYKTGFFFIGTLILILALAVITIVCILLTLNFVFNRKNNKKIIIRSIITSLILIGAGGGLMSVGLLNFEYIEDSKDLYKTDYLELEMNDKLFLETYYYIPDGIEYIESNNSNIKVEYQISEYSELSTYDYADNGVAFGIYYNNPIKLVNYVIKELNNKRIISVTNEFRSIKVYTTKENIEKLKYNKDEYNNDFNSKQNLINSYEKKINELQTQIDEYVEKIWTYEEETIPNLKDQLAECEYNSEYDNE